MVGVALRAEELRGKVAGYYIDKQIIIVDEPNWMLCEADKRFEKTTVYKIPQYKKGYL